MIVTYKMYRDVPWSFPKHRLWCSREHEKQRAQRWIYVADGYHTQILMLLSPEKNCTHKIPIYFLNKKVDKLKGNKIISKYISNMPVLRICHNPCWLNFDEDYKSRWSHSLQEFCDHRRSDLYRILQSLVGYYKDAKSHEYLLGCKFRRLVFAIQQVEAIWIPVASILFSSKTKRKTKKLVGNSNRERPIRSL